MSEAERRHLIRWENFQKVHGRHCRGKTWGRTRLETALAFYFMICGNVIQETHGSRFLARRGIKPKQQLDTQFPFSISWTVTNPMRLITEDGSTRSLTVKIHRGGTVYEGQNTRHNRITLHSISPCVKPQGQPTSGTSWGICSLEANFLRILKIENATLCR